MLSKKRSVPSHSYDYSCYTELAVLPTSLCQSPGSCSNSCGGNVALAKRNKRHKTTMAQLAMLEERYMMDKTPSQIDRFQLAKSLGMSPRQVQVWFQNRRAKERRDHETQEFERSLSEENTLAAAAQRQHRVSDVKMFADGAASQNNCNGRAPGCANNSDIEFKGILGISGKFNCTVDYPLPMPTPLGK